MRLKMALRKISLSWLKNQKGTLSFWIYMILAILILAAIAYGCYRLWMEIESW